MTLKIRYFFHRRNPRLPNQTGICPQIAGGDIIESFIKICLGPGTLLRKGISSKGCLPFWCNWAIQQSLPSSTCYTQNQRNIVPEMMPSFFKKTRLTSPIFSGCWLLIWWITLDSWWPSRINPSQVVEAGQKKTSLPTKIVFSREFGWNFPRV